MNVRQLKKALEEVDENLEVFIRQNNDEFEYSLLEIAEEDEIDFFIEEYDITQNAPSKCLILTDEI